MPVTILTPLLLCMAWLAPASRPEPVPPAGAATAMTPAKDEVPALTVGALPVPQSATWTLPDADTEEEPGDGEPEGIAPGSARLDLPRAGLEPLLPFHARRATASRPTRSRILRC